MNARHEGESHHSSSHYINVKYGYIVFALSIVHVSISLLFHHIYQSRWASTRNSRDWTRRLVSAPVWVPLIVWGLVLAALMKIEFTDFKEQYTSIFKRFGRFSFSLVPFCIALAIRLPNAVFAQGFYINFLALHKWIARLILLFGLVHGIGFGIRWISKGTLEKALKPINVAGEVVSLLSVVVLVISVRGIRRKFYQSFYFLHTVTVWLFIGLITWHARPGVIEFSILAAVLVGYQLLQRLYLSFETQATTTRQPNSSLQVVHLTKPENFPRYLPGSHIRLSNGGSKSLLQATHPYTIVSEDAETVTLITKLNNFAASLETPFSHYTLIGPFPALPPNFFGTAKQVQIVCGGAGISFGIPILNYFHARAVTVTLVWFTPSTADLHVLNYATEVSSVYITKSEEHEESQELLNNQDSEIELHPLQAKEDTSNERENGSSEMKSTSKYTVKYGRPILSSVLVGSDFVDSDSVDTSSDPSTSWVIACGPDSLVKECQQWAVRNSTQFFSERYVV